MAQPKITLDAVRHVSRLAALSLAPDEQERMCRELDKILGFMAELDKLDVSGVEPTFHAVPMRAQLRPDVVVPSLPRDELLQAAPAQESGAFAVPKVLDGDK
ncbi:MAG TPA: Asp-tRNA(Asn)/Glu-tRNA(Gln) amidotransferase subunit GatC [Polyangiales bacterium]